MLLFDTWFAGETFGRKSLLLDGGVLRIGVVLQFAVQIPFLQPLS